MRNDQKTAKRGKKLREVLQTEFRFLFRKDPRQISAGPGWSTPEEVEPNFLFCKPNFLFRIDSINPGKRVGDSPHRDVQADYREVEPFAFYSTIT